MSSHNPSAGPHALGLPQPGSAVGAYVIERQIGHGGMAIVFEARHRVLNKRVALKMLLPQIAAEPEMAHRFAREAAAAAQLNHPNAVDVVDVGTDQYGAPYLVMELLEGEDLSALLQRDGSIGVQQAADILVPVISAIAAAHDLGIVHRDLKPQNVFLAQRRGEQVPKVLDFGISKAPHQSMKLTSTRALLGTPQYMSPEQTHGASKVDARSDQFAVGVMLYECLTGKTPFDGETLYAVLAQIVHAVHVRPSQLVPSLPRELDQTIARALQKDPADRYPDMRTLGAALIPHAGMRVRLSFATEFGLSTPTQEMRISAHSWAGTPAEARGSVDTEVRPQGALQRAVPLPARVGSLPEPRLSWGRIGISLGVAAAIALGGYGLASRRTSREPAARHPSESAPAGSAQAEVRDTSATPPAQPSSHDSPAPAPKRNEETTRAASEEVPNTPSKEAERPTYEVDLSVTPALAWIMFDEKPAGTGRLQRTLKNDGATHTVRVGAPGHRTRTLKFKDVPPVTTLTLEKIAQAQVTQAPAKPTPVVPKGPFPARTQPAPVPTTAQPSPTQPRYGTNGALILD